MHKNIFRYLKVIAKRLVIAFLFATSIIFITFLIFGKKIDKSVALINKVFVFNNSYQKRDREVEFDKVKKKLKVYPRFGEVFGNVLIPSIKVDVTLYHGESLKNLKYGLGHHAGSFFPGEGGSIIIAGHNTYGQLYDLPKVKIGDMIIIKTIYGNYSYSVSNTYVIDALELNRSLSLNNDKESVMLYTCYPVEIPGFKSKRFVVVADLVGDSDEE